MNMFRRQRWPCSGGESRLRAAAEDPDGSSAILRRRNALLVLLLSLFNPVRNFLCADVGLEPRKLSGKREECEDILFEIENLREEATLTNW
jgi:hypothetical protein